MQNRLEPLRKARKQERVSCLPAFLSGSILALSLAAPAEAQEGETELRVYYDAMAERRLIAPETGSVERLREIVRQGEQLYLDDRYEEAHRVLYEAVESPRFSDFDANDEYRSAEYMLASALQRLGALRSAWRYLERILARGPQDPYFGPAYRRAIDVALAGADLRGTIERLIAAAPADSLDPDAQNELLYVQGIERYDAHDWTGAISFFEQVGRQSRFYANARYLQGVIAAQANELETAEGHFCAVASTPDTDQFTFFVDRRYFDIRDLTWLALGRVAHEGRRPEDALYYYFQVPQDSARVTEALFESAWAMYEGDDHDTAIDLLDQLEARFPDSPYVHEASLLRGYVHLARCEFEDADRHFIAFQERFTPVVHAIDAILESAPQQDRLFEQLLATEARQEEATAPEEGQAPGEGGEAHIDVHELLLSLLTIDPTFYRLYSEVRTLDAEAARAGRVSEELSAIAARLAGGEAPQPAVEDDALDDVTAMRRDLDGARAILRALTEQLEAMRREGAAADRIAPLSREIVELGRRVTALERGLNELASQAPPEPPAGGSDIESLLRRDRALASRFDARVVAVRAQMVGAANEAALRGLRALRRDLGGHLRRSRIGRIDAVMGSKRRIEIQIESLAAGRFPPELQDPLSIQGLLRDDEEYWPFEGEYWADEFEEDESEGEDDLDSEEVSAPDDVPAAEEEAAQ
jgi:hypothetical protein